MVNGRQCMDRDGCRPFLAINIGEPAVHWLPAINLGIITKDAIIRTSQHRMGLLRTMQERAHRGFRQFMANE